MRALSLPVVLIALTGLSFASHCAAHDDCDDDDATTSYSTSDDDESDGGWVGSTGGYDESDRDTATRTRVQEALWRTLGQGANAIEIEVDGRSVVLSGWVRTSFDREQAHDIAHQVSGVTHVYYDALSVQAPRHRYGSYR